MAALKMERCRQAGERPLAAYGLAPVERFVFLPGLGRRERVLEVRSREESFVFRVAL